MSLVRHVDIVIHRELEIGDVESFTVVRYPHDDFLFLCNTENNKNLHFESARAKR
jgi:hypothetical protein